jgi:hypothetical protein
VLPNNRISSNFYPRPKPRASGHHCVRMNLSFSLRAHKFSALRRQVSFIHIVV